MENKTKNVNVDDLLFSREAADYLSVTVQRLNQLVHAGELVPIKKSSSGMLFLKSDLDERIRRIKYIALEMKKEEFSETINFATPFMREVLTYYTIQSLLGFSDKKTEPIYESLKEKVDLGLNIQDIYEPIASHLSVQPIQVEKAYKLVIKSFEKLHPTDKIIKKGMVEYPKLLAATEEAPPYLFLRGKIELLSEKIVSVVGSRNSSEEGQEKAKRLAIRLGRENIVIASGLARGIDTAAHTAALENNIFTIAVIGTPITKVYPKENETLQKRIGKEGLIVSQFPPSSPVERWHFPMRNAVMSGISLATAIVEAGETSGALKQANYALKQGRLVFIPQSACENKKITWPDRYINKLGAKKFSKIDELLSLLEQADIIKQRDHQISFIENPEEVTYVRRLE